jgi:hypothetical protein
VDQYWLEDATGAPADVGAKRGRDGEAISTIL